MNDLYYIEYKPELMLCDSMDMDPETELAHRRLCDFIWRMDKVPKADNEFLKQFTRTTSQNWSRVKKGLLEKGWAEVAGLFIHKGAVETLNAAKEKYAAQCNQTAPATAKKTGQELKLLRCVRDPVTGIVTLNVTTPVSGSETSLATTSVMTNATASVSADVTTNVTTNVTKIVTTPQLELKPEPVIKERAAREADFPEANVPTWEEVKTMAEMSAVAEPVAKAFFDHHESLNLWRNKHGIMINVRPALLVWANREREKINGTNRNGSKNGSHQRIDRSIGTANEGRASRYKGLGGVVQAEPAQRS